MVRLFIRFLRLRTMFSPFSCYPEHLPIEESLTSSLDDSGNEHGTEDDTIVLLGEDPTSPRPPDPSSPLLLSVVEGSFSTFGKDKDTVPTGVGIPSIYLEKYGTLRRWRFDIGYAGVQDASSSSPYSTNHNFLRLDFSWPSFSSSQRYRTPRPRAWGCTVSRLSTVSRILRTLTTLRTRRRILTDLVSSR